MHTLGARSRINQSHIKKKLWIWNRQNVPDLDVFEALPLESILQKSLSTSPGNEGLKKVFDKKTDLYIGIYRIFLSWWYLRKAIIFCNLLFYTLRGSDRLALWFFMQPYDSFFLIASKHVIVLDNHIVWYCKAQDGDSWIPSPAYLCWTQCWNNNVLNEYFT